MSNRASNTLTRAEDIPRMIRWVHASLNAGIEGGPVAVDIYRPEETRSLEQNNKQWAMYQDLASQLTWHGKRMSKEDWKVLLCNEWKPQRVVPAISDGFCVLNASTSKSSKGDFSDLVEIVYAFGSNHGVKWSEPSLKSFEQYREAQSGA